MHTASDLHVSAPWGCGGRRGWGQGKPPPAGRLRTTGGAAAVGHKGAWGVCWGRWEARGQPCPASASAHRLHATVLSGVGPRVPDPRAAGRGGPCAPLPTSGRGVGSPPADAAGKGIRPSFSASPWTSWGRLCAREGPPQHSTDRTPAPVPPPRWAAVLPRARRPRPHGRLAPPHLLPAATSGAPWPAAPAPRAPPIPARPGAAAGEPGAWGRRPRAGRGGWVRSIWPGAPRGLAGPPDLGRRRGLKRHGSRGKELGESFINSELTSPFLSPEKQ